MYHQPNKGMVHVSIRDEILTAAIDGRECTPTWAAEQTIRLYRRNVVDGLPHEDAVAAAKQEMAEIAAEALRQRRNRFIAQHIAPWAVVVLGTLACIGWYLLWE